MIEAALSNSRAAVRPPSTDDDLTGMAWWNNLSEKNRRHWLCVAQSARPVDAWRAFKGALLSGRKLDPKDVLTDLFEELHADDPEWLAEQVQRRLADAGFSIVPTDELPPTSRASHYSG